MSVFDLSCWKSSRKSLVTMVQTDKFQCLSLSDSAPPIRNVHTRNSWVSCWLPDTLVLFPGSCARQPEELYSWEQDSTLWLDACNDLILHFRPLWRCVWATGWYYSLWSTGLSNVLSRQNPFACYQQLILYYKTRYCIEPWWCYLI